MSVLRILINILFVVTNDATPLNFERCYGASVSDKIFHDAADEIILRVKYPNKKLLNVKGLSKKEFKLKRLNSNKRVHFFEIKTNDKRNIIKYYADAQGKFNEINMYSKIKSQYIVKVHKTYMKRSDTGYFLLMEPMDGSLSITYAIQYPKEIRSITKSIVHALKYLKTKEIYYHNIKLENVLFRTVNNKKIYKICDFRLARRCSEQPEDLYSFGEEDTYTAPEIIRHSTIHQNSDIWMLGRLIKFYKDKKIMYSDPHLSDWKNSCRYLRFIVKLEKEQENKSSNIGIVNRCCAVDPELRSSFDDILKWCEQDE